MIKLFPFFCLVNFVTGAKLPTFDPKSKLIDSKFHLDDRIVGGQEIPIEDAPYFVQIEKGSNFWIGGTILNENHVITCADYLYEVHEDDIKVRAGSAHTLQNGTIHSVVNITKHDLYTGTMAYNVAILKVTPYFEFNEKVQNISLSEVQPANGSNATIVGFGATDHVGVIPVSTLHATTTQVTDRDSCSVWVDITEMCNTDSEQSTCSFDEGGPLVVNGELAGVTSYSYCVINQVSSFTVVAMVRDWILETIEYP